jgi:hypothetical protein
MSLNRTASLTPSLVLNPSLYYHPMMHWLHHRTATMSSKHLGSTTALRLKKLPISGIVVSIYCDASARRSQLYIPAPLWLQVFLSAHDLLHPGTEAMVKLVAQGFVVRRAKGLPHLGMCLPVLPKLQSRLPHIHSIGWLYTTGSPLFSHPHRPRWATSNISGLHALLHCKSTISPGGQKSSQSWTSQPTLWHTLLTSQVSLQLPADHHHLPGMSVSISTFPIPAQFMWHSALVDNRPPPCC